MNYALHMDEQLPIGSGVTEAACKTLVKQRLNESINPPLNSDFKK
jgi:hypothetical protein